MEEEANNEGKQAAKLTSTGDKRMSHESSLFRDALLSSK